MGVDMVGRREILRIATIRLMGALVPEQHDEWAASRHQMSGKSETLER